MVKEQRILGFSFLIQSEASNEKAVKCSVQSSKPQEHLHCTTVFQEKNSLALALKANI